MSGYDMFGNILRLFKKGRREGEVRPTSELATTAVRAIHKFMDFYPIFKDYVYVFIYVDVNGTPIYEVIEPPLNPYERILINNVKEYIFEGGRLAEELRSATDIEEGVNLVRKNLLSSLSSYRIKDPAVVDKISYYIARDLVGYSIIDPLIRDNRLEDIVCDGLNIPIHVFHRDYEWLKTNIVISNENELEVLVRRLAFKAGQEISIARPIVEGLLKPEGFRVHLVLDVVSRRGATFTIRKFRSEPFTLPDLINLKTINPLVAAYLWMMVENLQSMVIIGPTASGKTTLLNAVALMLPPEVKVVTIEETPEINLIGHDNWISLVTRLSSEEGVQDVTLFDLLKSALRQRPDVVIVGEIRGEEAYTFFQAISLGHGGLTTIHGDNIEAVIHRLQSPPMDIHKSLLPLVKIYVHISRVEVAPQTIARRVIEVKEVEGIDPRTGELTLHTPFKWLRDSDAIAFTKYSHLIEVIAKRKQISYEDVFNDLLRRATIMKWMAKHKVGVTEIRNIVRRYRIDWLTPYTVAEAEVGPYEVG